MAQTRNTEDEKVTDRRNGEMDRRMNEDRRNLDRLSYMDADCRSDVPRRNSDIISSMIEGELWWSRQQIF